LHQLDIDSSLGQRPTARIYQEDKEKIENSWQETFAQDIQQANYDEETEEGW
jgi:hypothetical protein